ncbi:MAG: hypothetical protein IAF38_03220 [Bacteroidia bacterium]|nr:hypothetical protein [Bacteroidia bacterium]
MKQQFFILISSCIRKNITLWVTVFTLTGLFHISCTSPEKEYKKNGISFTVPSGWKIANNSNSDHGYIFCERDGIVPKGVITISWFNDSLNTHEELLKNISQLKETLKIQNPEFDSIQKCFFGSYEALCSNYKMGISGVNSVGYIKCFYTNKKTFTIQLLEGTNVAEENTEAKKKISTSFKCYD